MSNDAKKTNGGVYIKVDTDKRGVDHVDFYDSDPRGPHIESIHISIKPDGSGKITTKSGDSPRETTDIKCFLTTACMRYFEENFDDNCYELTMMRWLRDNIVTEEDVEYYYMVAPLIVEGINMEKRNDIIYNYIYDNVIDYCVEQLEQGNYAQAYSRYKNSFLALEKQFARPVLEQKMIKSLKLNR